LVRIVFQLVRGRRPFLQRNYRGRVPLLYDVSELVGEQRVSNQRAWPVFAGAKRHVVTDRECSRVQTARKGRCAPICMYPHLREAVSERRFHPRPGAAIETPATAQLRLYLLWVTPLSWPSIARFAEKASQSPAYTPDNS